MTKEIVSAAKHTPGPWRTINRFQDKVDVVHEAGAKIGGASLVVARVIVRDSWLEEQMANARLIAAAPELLEVARLLVEANCPEAVALATQRAHAAITKTRGEA